MGSSPIVLEHFMIKKAKDLAVGDVIVWRGLCVYNGLKIKVHKVNITRKSVRVTYVFLDAPLQGLRETGYYHDQKLELA